MGGLLRNLKWTFGFWLLRDHFCEIVLGHVKTHSGVEFCDWGSSCFPGAIPACGACIHHGRAES